MQKFIVKSKSTGKFWLSEGKGGTHCRSEAYRYTRKELETHRFAYNITCGECVLIPVKD